MSTTPDVDALVAQVAATNGVIESVIVFLNGIVPLLESVAGNKAATLAVTEDIRVHTDALAAAVAAVPPGA
jgi:hypothetical protein